MTTDPSALSRLPADADSRFQRLGLKLALFIGVGLLLGGGLLLGLAVRQGYFSPKTPVYFIASSGSDLRPGMAVKLSGFKIGQVHSVELNQRARVDVEMQIEDKYMHWIKSDSVATLAREGMIGDSFISVTSGNPDLPALAKEDGLRFVLGSSLGDIAQDVRNRVVPVIDEMHVLLKYANDPEGDVRGSFAALHQLTVDLQKTRQQLEQLLAHADTLAGKDVPETLAQTRMTLQRADAGLQEIERAVPALNAKAAAALESLNTAAAAATQTATKAEKLLDEATPRLNNTLHEAESLVRDSRSAVNAARTRWPFKGPDAVLTGSDGDTPPPAKQ
jgi:phospholipid/cholesterol/gamma-HCH transport system substrate-binding protein